VEVFLLFREADVEHMMFLALTAVTRQPDGK